MTDVEKIAKYLEGYTWALRDGTAALAWARDNWDSNNDELPVYWMNQGIFDARSGTPSRFSAGQTVITAGATQTQQQNGTKQTQPAVTALPGVRTAPAYQSKGGPQTPVLAPGPALEKGAPVTVSYQSQANIPVMAGPRLILAGVRYLELACYRNRKLIPYDQAVQIQRNPLSAQLAGLAGAIVQLLRFDEVTFDLLGDDPGEQREGYRISGPTGPLARMIQREIAAGVINPNPRAYGLTDWVGAHLSSGRIKIISSQELDRLGLYSN